MTFTINLSYESFFWMDSGFPNFVNFCCEELRIEAQILLPLSVIYSNVSLHFKVNILIKS